MTTKHEAALRALERWETFGQDCSRCLRITCPEHVGQRDADLATIRDALTAQGEARVCTGPCHGSVDTCRHCEPLRESIARYREAQGEAAPANVVGTCDWGDCDGETVGVRLDSDAQWLAVCAQHSPVCRAMDAIWRLTCLPFSDNDRRQIQGIALAWIDGTGPREGSAVAQWLADPAPSAPPAHSADTEVLKSIIRNMEEELNEAGVYLSGEFAELVDAAIGELK